MPGKIVLRRLARRIDLSLTGAVALLVFLGLTVVYSSTHGLSEGAGAGYLKRQAFSLVIGLVVAALIFSIDYETLGRLSKPLYAANLLLLVGVLAAGRSVSGTQGWFRVGSLSFQPSEVAKLVVTVTLGQHLSCKRSLERPVDLISPIVHVALPAVLILLQPDFGTAMVFAAILFGMLYVAGANSKHIVLLISAAMLAGVAIGPSLYTDALGAPGSPGATYVEMMRFNARAIVEALSK